MLLISSISLGYMTQANSQEQQSETKIINVEPAPISGFLVFGFSVDVKIVQLEPGEDYVDLEVLNKPLYLYHGLSGLTTINSGAFVRLYEAKGVFNPSFPLCLGICTDYGIIG